MRLKGGSDWLSCYTSQDINLRRCDRTRADQIQQDPINFLRRATLRKLWGVGGGRGRATPTVGSETGPPSKNQL